jgi:hypothetical protein
MGHLTFDNLAAPGINSHLPRDYILEQRLHPKFDRVLQYRRGSPIPAKLRALVADHGTFDFSVHGNSGIDFCRQFDPRRRGPDSARVCSNMGPDDPMDIRRAGPS